MRYKRVRVSGQIIVNLSTQDGEFHVKCISGLPTESRFIYSIPDIMYGIWIVVEHESFPELKEGDKIPEFEGKIEFNRI